MNESTSRRSFLATSIGGATAFQIIRPELVRGQGAPKMRAGLIGCGGRGTEAMQNILNGTDNVEIVAMADVFEDRMETSIRTTQALKPELSKRFKVDAEHRFVGFDAYKKLVASDIDIVMLAANPGYRPMHFEAAVEAKKHIFCEKPMGTDATGVRRFMAAAKKSEELKLTVKSGAQRRSQVWYLDQYKRVKN
ncbi:MAG TPA: Gfo/Idh/MocA family oxidoreductase, partial [Polyangia bacterium]